MNMKKYKYRLLNLWWNFINALDKMYKYAHLKLLNIKYKGDVPKDVLGEWLVKSSPFSKGLADYNEAEENQFKNMMSLCNMIVITAELLSVEMMELATGQLIGDSIHNRIESDTDWAQAMLMLNSVGEDQIIDRFIETLLFRNDIQEHQKEYVKTAIKKRRSKEMAAYDNFE